MVQQQQEKKLTLMCCCRVRKAAPGSAVFEVVEEEVLQGVVVDRLLQGKGGLTINAGVLEHGLPGCTCRLIFTAEDLQVTQHGM